VAQADVVEHRRGFDDLGRGIALGRIKHPRERGSKVVGQLGHGHLETIRPRCSLS
jgi:hypothetical protein